MEKILAIYDDETVYMTRFIDYLNLNTEMDFAIRCFTKKESLEAFLLQSSIEILVLGAEDEMNEIPKEGINLILYLSELSEGKNTKGAMAIYKYQAASVIWKDIASCYSRRMSQRKEEGAEPVDIIAVVAPVQGMSEQSYGWYLAQNLALEYKTLLITMELLPIVNQNSASPPEANLSEFIYYLKENNSEAIVNLKNQLQVQGKLSHLYGITHGMDLLSLTMEDGVRWIKELTQEKVYEKVVFYLGFYSEFAIEVVKQSKKVLILAEDSSYGRSLMKEWNRQMVFMEGKSLRSDYHFLYLTRERSIEEGDGEEDRDDYLQRNASNMVNELYGKERL